MDIMLVILGMFALIYVLSIGFEGALVMVLLILLVTFPGIAAMIMIVVVVADNLRFCLKWAGLLGLCVVPVWGIIAYGRAEIWGEVGVFLVLIVVLCGGVFFTYGSINRGENQC